MRFHAVFEGVLFPGHVFTVLPEVVLIGQADDFFQIRSRGRGAVRGQTAGRIDHHTQAESLFGFDHNLVAEVDHQVTAVKVVDFAAFPKANTDDFSHKFLHRLPVGS